jgi:hypothetical protein
MDRGFARVDHCHERYGLPVPLHAVIVMGYYPAKRFHPVEKGPAVAVA